MDSSDQLSTTQNNTLQNQHNDTLETTKIEFTVANVIPIFDEVDRLKEEIEYKRRTLKEKEAEAFSTRINQIDQTKKYYKELLQ